MTVRPKKYLGQHFLHSQSIAEKIVASLNCEKGNEVLEIGPGMGVLTKLLLQNERVNLSVVEVDEESIAYLKTHFPQLSDSIYHRDFLNMPLEEYFSGNLCIIGNFPYNISSQILFRVLHYKDMDPKWWVCFRKKWHKGFVLRPAAKVMVF